MVYYVSLPASLPEGAFLTFQVAGYVTVLFSTRLAGKSKLDRSEAANMLF